MRIHDTRAASNLSALRVLRGLSVRGLEAATGIPKSSLHRYATGVPVPSRRQRVIADVLGVTVEELFGGDAR